MKPVYIFLTYVFGFFLFYKIMSIMKVDEFVFYFITPQQQTKQKEGDILTPFDAKKPLALTKQEIGRHAWAVLHSVAASFPALPNEEDKKNVENFINGLAHNFPCKICGKHFIKMLNEYPIKDNSREELVYYLCDIHNKVNRFLKKPIFDCKNAFDIWGGDCGCEA